MQDKRIVALIKWGIGYPADDFNRTYRAIQDHSEQDVEVICVTDDPSGLDQGMQIVKLPEISLDRSRWNDGMWPKVALFKDDVFPNGAKILYVDVDIAVVGDVSKLFDFCEQDTLHIIKDWNTYHERWFPRLFPSNRGGNSSVLCYRAGEHNHIWDAFTDDPDAALAQFRNDQDYAVGKAKNIKYFPDGLVGSFKKTVAPLPPIAWFSGCNPSKDCKIVAFHGKPDIEDLTLRNRSYLQLLVEGYGRVPWLEEYLNKYD